MPKNFLDFGFKQPKIRTPKIKSPSLRGALPRKRDLARATNIFNKPIREPVSAKTRTEVLLRAKNKCQSPGCSFREGGYIKLEIHHKNMINDDNRPSNLMALCANHHKVMHKRYKVVHNKDLTGRRISSKVVKKKMKFKKSKTKKRKTSKRKSSKQKSIDLFQPIKLPKTPKLPRLF